MPGPHETSSAPIRKARQARTRLLLAVLFLLGSPIPITSIADAQDPGATAPGRTSARAVSEFNDRAWRIQEGRLRITCDIDPDRRRTTFDRTRWLLTTIEQVFTGMRTRRPSDGLEVWYAKDRPTYLALIREVAGADGTNTAGMAAYGGRRTMLFVRGLEWPTIQHEAWHASRSVFIPAMPKWLDEGIAEVFDHGTFLQDQFVIGGITESDIARVKSLFETGNWIPLARFMREDDGWNQRLREGTIRGRAQYVQAWAVSHFLLFADEGRHRSRMNTFLRSLNSGMDEWQAFDAAIGANERTVATLEREIREFFEQARPVDPKETHRTLLEWAEEEAASIPPRGRVDPDATTASLAARLSRPELGTRSRDATESITVKPGRNGQGPVIRIDPLDGLGWEVRFERNRARRRSGDDPAGQQPAWIPRVRWSLSG